MGDACEQLGIAPKAFRQLMTEFGDLIDPPRPSTDGLGQEISQGSLGVLKKALERRNLGQSIQEIRAALKAQSDPGAVRDAGLVAAPASEVAAGMEQVAATATLPAQGAAAAPLLALASEPETYDELVKRVETLAGELAKSEERRAEDRDRLLTALMRNQQEIQHLRFELVTHHSRKERKKRGFWARLFG